MFFSRRKMYNPDPMMRVAPKIVETCGISPQMAKPIAVAQIIELYENGATTDAGADCNALIKQRWLMHPTNPHPTSNAQPIRSGEVQCHGKMKLLTTAPAAAVKSSEV